MHWLVLFLSIVGMIFGAIFLVRSCIKIAKYFNVSEFLISFLIIGIGTALPELLVAFLSDSRGMGDLIVSNRIVSNIINIFGALGLAAIVFPIAMRGRKHLADIIFMIIATVMLCLMVFAGPMGKIDALLLILLMIAYVVWIFTHQDNSINKQQVVRTPIHWMDIVYLILGVALLFFASDWFMNSVSGIGQDIGMDNALIAALIVAPATSVPEILVTVIAAIKHRPQIVIGNIVGSIFINLDLVIGIGVAKSALTVSSSLYNLDILAMIVATAMLCYDLLVRKRITRFTGALYIFLLIFYFWAIIHL